MTEGREFFSELNSDVRGSVKFGDASAVEIKGVGSVVFTAKTGDHLLLTYVYYVPVPRNSIIILGQRMRTARVRSRMVFCGSGIAIIAFSPRLAEVPTASTSSTCRRHSPHALQPVATMTLGGGTSVLGTSTLRP